ncbi:MAG: Rha family transcriptional regulator [Chromatiaceae bacterium]
MAVADGCGLQHKNVFALVRRYQDDFKELGILAFETREKRGTQGAPTEYAVLNEDQATYLITLFRNSPVVRRFKLTLVKAFRKALDEIGRLYANLPRPDLLTAKRAAHHPMMAALVECREEVGKETASHHFTNENRLCNGVVTGNFQRTAEHTLTNSELLLLAKVRERNAALLMAGLDYATRKTKLITFALRTRTQLLTAT